MGSRPPRHRWREREPIVPSLNQDERNRLILENLDSAHLAAKVPGLPRWMRDELVSVANEALVRASTRFVPTMNAAFSTFAYVPVRGAVRDYFDNDRRSQKRYGTAPYDTVSETTYGHFEPSSDFDRLVLTREILAAVERLPPDARQLLKAYYFDDETLSSAGARLGLSKTRAYVRLSQAIQLLRDQLDDGVSSWVTPQAKPAKRRFTKQYKESIVARAQKPSANINQLARELNVPSSTVHTWLKSSRKSGSIVQGAA